MSEQIGARRELQNRIPQKLQSFIMDDLLMAGLIRIGSMGKSLMKQAQIGKGDTQSPRKF